MCNAYAFICTKCIICNLCLTDVQLENQLSAVSVNTTVAVGDSGPQALQLSLSVRPEPHCVPAGLDPSPPPLARRVFAGDPISMEARVGIGYAVTFQWRLMTTTVSDDGQDAVVDVLLQQETCQTPSCRTSTVVRA